MERTVMSCHALPVAFVIKLLTSLFKISFRQVGFSIDRREAHRSGYHSPNIHRSNYGLILLRMGCYPMLPFQEAQGELRYGDGGMCTHHLLDWFRSKIVVAPFSIMYIEMLIPHSNRFSATPIRSQYPWSFPYRRLSVVCTGTGYRTITMMKSLREVYCTYSFSSN